MAALRRLAPTVVIRARSTVHRHNFRFLRALVAKARELGVDQISFLAADVASDAFNRAANGPPPTGLLLAPDEVDELEARRSEIASSAPRRARSPNERSPWDPRVRAGWRATGAQLGQGELHRPSIATRRGPACSSGPTVPSAHAFFTPVGNVRERALFRTTAVGVRCRAFAAASTWRRTRCAAAVCPALSLAIDLRSQLW